MKNLFFFLTVNSPSEKHNTGMAPNWVIEDEAMKVLTAPGKKTGHGAGGDILYKEKKFKNFELSVDWKTPAVRYSGL